VNFKYEAVYVVSVIEVSFTMNLAPIQAFF